MFSVIAVIATIVTYAGVLFLLAQLGERTALGHKVAAHPVTFALGLTVYCTTWTFFGSVGKAASAGVQYLPIYLGPTLAMLAGSTVFARIARLKHAHHLTSVADFISALYGKSQRVAALVTASIALGSIPYIALQIKSILSCFSAMTGNTGAIGWFAPLIVALMIAFTIVFGIRHLDPTERHPGMVTAVAAEGIFKLVSFLAAGAFVVGLVFPTTGTFFAKLDETAKAMPTLGISSGNDVLTFATTTILSAAAFCLLPRQFHQGIIENSKPSHVKTAVWLTPLYLLAINVFVIPIAIGGKLLATKGTSPDVYVLALPLQSGHAALSVAVFLGGFSAALGMVIVETMTLATMVSNHIVLPLTIRVQALAPLRSRQLYVRWAAAAVLLLLAWQAAVKLGASQTLVAIGLISFVAAFLLAPLVLGGLYWRGASERGAVTALASGFVVWFYTLIIPTFVRSHWMSEALLTAGPYGIGWLKPEALFGIAGLPSLVHGAMTSSAATVFAYVTASTLWPSSKEERLLVEGFLGDAASQVAHLDDRDAAIELQAEAEKSEKIFAHFMSLAEARRIVAHAVHEAVPKGRTKLTVVEYAAFLSSLERMLAGAVGSATAHGAMKEVGSIERKDRREIEREFVRVLADLKLSPRELKSRVDFEKEKAQLLEEQYRALERKNGELEARVLDRTRELRAILDNVVFGFLVVGRDLVIREGHTQSCLELLGTDSITGRSFVDVLKLASGADYHFRMCAEQVFEDLLPESLSIEQMPQRFPVGEGGRVLRAEARAVRDAKGEVQALLFTLSDITRIEASERENESNRAVLGILRNCDAFRAFIGDVREQLEAASAALAANDDATVRRIVHTIKGNAGMYGLASLAAEVHRIEEAEAITSEHLAEIGEELRAFLTANEATLAISLDDETRSTWSFGERDVTRLQEISTTFGETERRRVQRWLREVTSVPARTLLGPVDQMLQSIAARREKKVDATLSGMDVRMDAGVMKPVMQSVVHLLRNCVDHGIEQIEERGDKPSSGRIAVDVAATAAEYVVRISDDGRGIDVDSIAATAARRGVVDLDRAETMSFEEKLELMFADGVSTSETVSDVSGRGVGMSAVKAEVERAGGRLLVRTAAGVGTTFEIHVPRAGSDGSMTPPKRSTRPPAAMHTQA